MSLPCCYPCTLNTFVTGKSVNNGGEYGPEIPADFNFCGKRPLNWIENKITKIVENRNKTVKHCLK